MPDLSPLYTDFWNCINPVYLFPFIFILKIVIFVGILAGAEQSSSSLTRRTEGNSGHVLQNKSLFNFSLWMFWYTAILLCEAKSFFLSCFQFSRQFSFYTSVSAVHPVGWCSSLSQTASEVRAHQWMACGKPVSRPCRFSLISALWTCIFIPSLLLQTELVCLLLTAIKFLSCFFLCLPTAMYCSAVKHFLFFSDWSSCHFWQQPLAASLRIKRLVQLKA